MPPSTIDDELPKPFKAERGASQGAVLSPTTWIEFFDTIHTLPGSHRKIDPAYMDDQITPSATLEAMQKIQTSYKHFYIN